MWNVCIYIHQVILLVIIPGSGRFGMQEIFTRYWHFLEWLCIIREKIKLCPLRKKNFSVVKKYFIMPELLAVSSADRNLPFHLRFEQWDLKEKQSALPRAIICSCIKKITPRNHCLFVCHFLWLLWFLK